MRDAKFVRDTPSCRSQKIHTKQRNQSHTLEDSCDRKIITWLLVQPCTKINNVEAALLFKEGSAGNRRLLATLDATSAISADKAWCYPPVSLPDHPGGIQALYIHQCLFWGFEPGGGGGHGPKFFGAFGAKCKETQFSLPNRAPPPPWPPKS